MDLLLTTDNIFTKASYQTTNTACWMLNICTTCVAKPRTSHNAYAIAKLMNCNTTGVTAENSICRTFRLLTNTKLHSIKEFVLANNYI